MPFRLTNAPSVFQRYINEVLKEYIDRGLVDYIDDILIYSKTEEELVDLTKKVLKKLLDNSLCVNAKKCVFHACEVEFVGYTIGQNGVKMSENKVKHILEWEAARPVHEVQQFLGFANFYRRFIRGYSSICHPLTQLTTKGQVWNWTNECQEAFNKLKVSFTEAPILTHYHPKKPLMIETDASDLAKGAVLSQYQDSDKKWHPVAFNSKKFSPAELNYDIHDKEMIVIVDCFKEWRHMLCRSPSRVMVYTDHRNLEYCQTTKILNRSQARWAEILSEFNFVITYRPGEKNGKADALSRRTDPALEGGTDTSISMFKPGQFAAVERTNQLLVQILGQNRKVPTGGTEFATGYDLYSAEEVTLKAKTRQAISPEIAILVQLGTYGRIASRSGLALKH